MSKSAVSVANVWKNMSMLYLIANSCFIADLAKSSENPITLKIQLGQMGHKPWHPNASALVRYNFNNAVFEKPFYLTREFEIRPGYISDWRWDFKEKQYVLTLADTSFQNGRQVTSRDVEFTILRSYLTRLDRQEKVLFTGIVGIDKAVKGTKYKPGMVDGIATPDNKTITIKLTQPNPLFLFSFSESLPALAPMEELEDDLYTFKKLPIGSGKYKVIESDPNSTRVKVERIRDLEKKGAPKFIEFYNDKDAIQNDVDIAINAGSTGIPENSKVYLQTAGELTTAVQVIDFNYGHPAANDENFRKFLDTAIDRKKAFATTHTIDRKLTFQMVPRDFFGSWERVDPFNQVAAAQLLEKVPKQIKNQEFLFAYHGGKGGLPPYIQSIKSDLEKFGLKINFQQTDRGDFQDEHRNALGYIYGKITNFIDPLAVFNFYLPNGPLKGNFPKENSLFMAQYKSAIEAGTVESKAPIIKNISRIFAENTFNIPLAEVKNFYAYKKRIKNLALDRIFLSLDFDLVEIETEAK